MVEQRARIPRRRRSFEPQELAGTIGRRVTFTPAQLKTLFGLTAKRPFRFLLAVLVLPGLAGICLLIWLGVSDVLSVELTGQAMAAVLTLIALVFALWQWRISTLEKSLDALYARIDIANQRQLEARTGRRVTPELTPAPPGEEGQSNHLWDHFVFAELDNLEYAIEKYKLGLVRGEVVSRAVCLFIQRCRDETQFRDSAVQLVQSGTYYEETRKIVSEIASWVRPSGSAGDGASAPAPEIG